AESAGSSIDRRLHIVELDVTAHGCLDTGERKVEAGVVGAAFERRFTLELRRGVAGGLLFDLCKWKKVAVRDTVGSERVHPRATGVRQAEQLCDLVIGFAGSVVERLANVPILP